MRDTRFVIDDVTVVDDGVTSPHHAVGIDDGAISWVRPAAAGTWPGVTTIAPGSDTFVMAGLTDMHSHYAPPSIDAEGIAMPLQVAHGVTSLRDMCGDVTWPGFAADALPIETYREWQRRTQQGSLVAPRFLAVSGAAINGPKDLRPGMPAFVAATDDESCRLLIAHQAEERRVDLIKIYSEVPGEGVASLLRGAREAGLPVAGHKPFSVHAAELAQMGQASIEHVLEILFDCFPGAAWFRTNHVYHPETPMVRAIVDEHDPDLADAILEAMARNGTALVPTLITRRMDAMAREPSLRQDPRSRSVPAGVRRTWLDDADAVVRRNPGPEGEAALRDLFGLARDFTRRAHLAGVRVMAGSDAGDSFSFYGSGLIDELEELAAAGIPTPAVLAAATTEPGGFLGDPALGRVRAGSPADLIVVDADPTRSLSTLRRPRGVVRAGTWYDRAALDAMIDGAETAAASSTIA